MSSMKAIKKRISSVNSTKKIMKAMNLVAASKLQKAKTRLDHIRPMFDNLTQVMDGIKRGLGPEDEIAFAQSREVKSIAYIILSGDRGLCGGFNTNVSKEALSFIESNSDKQEQIIAVGTKGWEYFKRRDKNIIHRVSGASEATSFADAEILGNQVAKMYASGEVDEVYIVYTHFETILAHVPHIVKLLPISTEASAEQDSNPIVMDYDPDAKSFIEHAVPMYLNITIYGAMIESAVCELASRMTSMDSATRNATEIIDDLTLEYNRKRQGMITQEITEIVTGANALN
ncbi:MAG: ATP synthase F1 subunit gamma [Oscillospiraceae bacterium]|nr:ATP synthase F1 subunit gamma [Oscillospiraceae bacterium]